MYIHTCATGSSSSLGKGLERRSLCSRYLFLGSSPLDPLLPLGHPFVRLPEIPSPNSESRPLTGRRPDGLGPTIYRLDSLVSLVAREREVDALCAARLLKGRKRGRERERQGERERGIGGWLRYLSVAASCLCTKRCRLRGIMGRRSFGRRDRTGVRSYEPVFSFLFGFALITAKPYSPFVRLMIRTADQLEERVLKCLYWYTNCWVLGDVLRFGGNRLWWKLGILVNEKRTRVSETVNVFGG